IRYEVQDRDEQDGDRLSEVDQVPDLGVTEYLIGSAQVAQDGGRMRGSQERREWVTATRSLQVGLCALRIWLSRTRIAQTRLLRVQTRASRCACACALRRSLSVTGVCLISRARA